MQAEEGTRRLRRARVVTLAALTANAAMALFLPAIGLWREPDPRRVALGAVGITLFVAAQAAVLHVLVTPWLGAGARRRAIIGLVAASVLSVPLVGPVGGSWPTWAWLASCLIGVLPVLARRPVAALASALVAAVTAAIAAANGDDPAGPVLIAVGIGLSIALLNALPVWFWDLLVQADQARDAQARLAASEERLRFARDVHDLLGHRLSVIALKAELAERLAPVDADRAGREAAEVRRMAASALAEVREVVHGYRQVDLRAELSAIEQVLRSSGVRCTVTAPDGDLPEQVAVPLAAVLREATTNVLRHSRATWCTIGVRHGGPAGAVTMTVVNDGVLAGGPDRHSYGLTGLAERLAEAGGNLRTTAGDGRFTVEAVVRSDP
ncbi:sensor histidine kinase [Jidongwangia harbinensis]|uniref:sensor histidine kinase n=1 Tax=Jidongwangia harbinensis TaxID=2878561 RepID=UPI001CDA1C90|nr:histidine kinase [Jidongwangia harbinensis]MCA2213503.1 histidine kinase [Jidongwangia harbinensis]